MSRSTSGTTGKHGPPPFASSISSPKASSQSCHTSTLQEMHAARNKLADFTDKPSQRRVQDSNKQSDSRHFRKDNPMNKNNMDKGYTHASDCKPSTSKSKDRPDEFRSTNGIMVTLHVADIVKATADAVVTSEDIKMKRCSRVTKALCHISSGGDHFKQLRENMRYKSGWREHGQVLPTSMNENRCFPFKYVLHAMLRPFDEDHPEAWMNDLFHVYENIFDKADKLQLKSVALPFLGTGCGADKVDAIKVAVQSTVDFKPRHLKNVQFVSLDKAPIIWAKEWCQTSLFGCDEEDKSSFSTNNNLDASDQEDEDCDSNTASSTTAANDLTSKADRVTDGRRQNVCKVLDLTHSVSDQNGNPDDGGGDSDCSQDQEEVEQDNLSQDSLDQQEADHSQDPGDRKENSNDQNDLNKLTVKDPESADCRQSDDGNEESESTRRNDYDESEDDSPKKLDTTEEFAEEKPSPESEDVVTDEKKVENPDHNASTSNVNTEKETCPICMDVITDVKTLDKCGHKFCRDCINDCFKHCKPICPSCQTVYGVITGNMPRGSMTQNTVKYPSLPGYLGCGHIIIQYHFPDGTQTSEHPHPGRRYRGTSRSGYLPDNKEGQLILKLLRLAFDRRLTFTVGRSVTTGRDDVVIWNDIHHKTSMHGGATGYGYPDETYLSRVKEELASKGVTEDQLDQH